MRRLRRRPTDDTGASLLLAIAFMTFLGLVSTALLSYTSASLRSTASTNIKAQSTYDIDGALQAAVNQIRTDGTYTNAPADPPCAPLTFLGPNTKTELQVTCVGGKGTGAAGGAIPITPANRPAHALLTLGTGAETGIAKGDDNLLLVRGDVYVNGTATSIKQGGRACATAPWPPASGVDCSGVGVDGGTLTARGSCDDPIVAPTGKTCDSPAAAAADPGYSQPNTWVYRPVPACAGGRTVTFEPGYYDDAVALTNLTDGGCKNKALHFKPGTYYFDFHNGSGAPLPAGSHVWTITDATTDVVGGTPSGWTPARGKPSIPGACVSPLATAANGGVQFVFGGDSRLDVKAGKVELCGQYSAGSPPIAVFGAMSGADPDVTAPVTAKSDGTGTSTGPAFTSPENITEQDDAASEADIVGGATDVTSEVTLKSFTPPTIPAGAILESASLSVWHREQSAASSALKSLDLSFTPNRSGAASTTRPVTRFVDGPGDGAFHETKLDLKSALSDEVHDFGLDGLQMKYTATVNAGESVTERLDSIQLSLTWRPPAVRGQTSTVNGGPNCVGIVAGCPMVRTRPPAKFYVQGTAYAPLAHLDIELEGVSAPVFLVGIIVRALKIQLHATDDFSSGAMIAVPDLAAGGAAKPLEVYFRAYTCPAGLTCNNPAPAAPWRLSGTARARYEDPDIFTPTPPYDSVTVLGWAVRRT